MDNTKLISKLENERYELNGKIIPLILKINDVDSGISEEQLDLMKEQLEFMKGYKDVLIRRIIKLASEVN